MKRWSSIALSTVVAALLVACGGGDAGDGGGGGDGGGNGGAATLTMVDNAFQPSSFTIQSGADVNLVNDGQALHNLSVDGEDISVDVDAGQSATETLDLAAGSYTMFCEYHRGIGMEGTLTVQ